MSLPTKQLPKSRSDKRRFWQHHVQHQARGKLTQRAYCERHGLGYASFVRWRGLLSTRQRPKISTASVGAFVPVQVQMSSNTSSNTIRRDTDSIDVIMPSGARIEGITSANLDLVAALVSRL